MSLWGKDEAAPGDVRRFWLAPLCAAGPSLHAQRTAAAQHIAWLLDTDTALRKGAAAAAAASVASAGSADASTGTSSAAAEEAAAPTVVLPRRLGAPDDEEAGAVAVGAVPETSARVLGALHFAVLFWPYDAQQPRLRRAYDAWHAAVRQTPLPADTRWAVSSEIEPALLVGNMNDPFWDLPEAIAGANQRPHAYALLRTLVRTETWSVDKCLSDARRLVARCGEQPPLLHAMFIIQQLFRYSGADLQQAAAEALEELTTATVFSDVYGAAQEQLVATLRQELLAPGLGFRRHVERCIARAEAAGTPTTARDAVVHCIAARDSSSSSSRDTDGLLALLSLWAPREHSPLVLRASLLAHTLGRALAMDPECVGVQFLPPELVAPLDARAAAVLDACLQAPSVAAAAQYRAAQLTDVLGEVQCRARVRVQTPLVDLGAAALAPLRAAVTQVALAPGQFRTGLRWNAVYHPDVLRVLEAVLQPDDERGVPARDAGTTLAVLGNDFLLRLVAGACLHLCAARGDDAAPLRDARFCLVPAPACRFAERLAARDPAYRTHVVGSLRYLTSVCPRVAAASSSTVALQQQQQQQRKRMGVRAVASDAMDGGCALPNPAACAAMLVESFCADAPCTLAVPVTVCQCDDLQRRTCHAHVFFAQCAVSSQMEKQQPAAAKQAFNVALAYDVVAPDGTTQHVAETRKIASATLSRPVAKLFRMDLVLATEEDSRKGRTQPAVPVSSVDMSISDASKGLFVIVDGQQCGPYTRLRFVRTPVTMRFAHYLPIS